MKERKKRKKTKSLLSMSTVFRGVLRFLTTTPVYIYTIRDSKSEKRVIL